MPLKDILVHLDASPRSAARLDVAAGLAARHDAHLTGLAVVDLPPLGTLGSYPSAFGVSEQLDDVIGRIRELARAQAAEAEALFRARLARDGLSGEWRMAEGEAGETVALHARYADLVVVAQPDPDGAGFGRAVDIPVTALLASGRPLLVVPYAGTFNVVGDNVLVGWNATPEAARAVNDALPLLRVAKRVTVLSVNPRLGIGGDGDVPAADIALHLARHGVTAEAAHTVAAEIGEADALLSYAADLGADLLVTGMYGHSRLREMMFGGVTHGLLREMTLPVFMAH